jgi:uncharacterized protein with FMN-binding domain
MKRVLKIIISIFIVLVLVVAGGILYITAGLNNSIEVAGIGLSNMKDGVYTGNYEGGRWSNKLEVKISNNKIVEILVKDDVTFVDEGVRTELFNRVTKAQNTSVDIVSGATITSKAYLKSIENAINTK